MTLQTIQIRPDDRRRFGAAALVEGLDERRKFVPAIPQRRNDRMDDREPVEQVEAKLARARHREQVAVGCRNDPNVDADRLSGADRTYRPRFENAQQFGLQVLRELADLVQEDRAAVRLGERAIAVGRGPGEGPALVAEQLGLDQAR